MKLSFEVDLSSSGFLKVAGNSEEISMGVAFTSPYIAKRDTSSCHLYSETCMKG